MRLNPYYMPRYWLRLARALYHQGRFGKRWMRSSGSPFRFPTSWTYLAAILACLGWDEAARGVIRELQTQEGVLTVGDLTRAVPAAGGPR
jgi:hypothetical protein